MTVADEAVDTSARIALVQKRVAVDRHCDRILRLRYLRCCRGPRFEQDVFSRSSAAQVGRSPLSVPSQPVFLPAHWAVS